MSYKQQLEQKKKRDTTLYKYHLEHPLISVRDLGKIFKLSGARVSQIIVATVKEEETTKGG